MTTISDMEFLTSGVLRSVADHAKKIPTPITAFLPVKGELYEPDRGFMLVGRATNEWIGERTASELETEEARLQFAQEAYAKTIGTPCPMRAHYDGWVTSGYARRSAFWKTAEAVFRRLRPDVEDERWASHIFWTNLYKVSPAKAEKGRPATPSEGLCHIQRAACQELFRREVEHNQPRQVLFVVGLNWANEFLLKDEWVHAWTAETAFAQAAGTRHAAWGQTDFVIAVRPESKKQSEWVDQVCAAFESLQGRLTAARS